MRRDVETVRESGFYSSTKWIKTRDFIRKRDEMTCQMCGDYTAEKFEVDHKIELTWDNVDDWNFAYNPDNLWLLCFSCHKKKTRQDKSGYNDRLLY